MDSGRGVSKYKKDARKRLITKFFLCVISFAFFVITLGNLGFDSSHNNRRVKREKSTDEDDVIPTNDPTVCENGGKWNKNSRSCACTLGWIGSRCNVWHNHYCFFDNGLTYRGKLSVTKSGTTCLPWTTDENLRFELGKNGVGIHNYCRNPDNDEKGLWCFVGGDQFVGYCNATKCPNSVKELLSLNSGEIGPADDSSAAVQFLFGPLISGVCAGVVLLLAFIAVAEYARRKRVFARKNKKENTVKKDKFETSMNRDEENGELTEKCYQEKKPEIRTLGGIITVDVDTGKEKVHTYTSKKMSKARQMLEQSNFGEDNNAFVLVELDEPRKVSVESNGTGPPPPYQLIDGNEIFTEDDREVAYAVPHESVLSSSLDIDVEQIETTNERRDKTKYRRNKRTKREESSQIHSDSPQTIIEKQNAEEACTRRAPASETDASNKRISAVTIQKKKRKTQEKHSVQNERDIVSKSREESTRQCESLVESTTNQKRRTRHASKATHSRSQERVTGNTNYARRGEELSSNTPSRQKRKSVRDLTKKFEEGNVTNFEEECAANEDESGHRNITAEISSSHLVEYDAGISNTRLNSRMEPTTFV